LKAWTIRDSLEESVRLLERYEQGLKGYTYLSGQA
jgi:arginine decarboxylase-like protein